MLCFLISVVPLMEVLKFLVMEMQKNVAIVASDQEFVICKKQLPVLIIEQLSVLIMGLI